VSKNHPYFCFSDFRRPTSDISPFLPLFLHARHAPAPRDIWIPAFAGMTTLKPYQQFAPLSDLRYLTSDILPFLPKAMDPWARPSGTRSQVFNLSGDLSCDLSGVACRAKTEAQRAKLEALRLVGA